MELEDKIKRNIREIMDYPKPGVLFKDITPMLANPSLVHEVVNELVRCFEPQHVDAIVGVEARGFIFGSILAHMLNCPFIPVRKSGKLPFKTIQQEYALEYGTASVEMHTDAVKQGWKVLIHDDLLATGGTAGAAARLVQQSGAEVIGFSFIINLSFLAGEKNLIEQFGIKPVYLVNY